MFDAAFLKDIDVSDFLADLKEKGDYPFEVAWWTVKKGNPVKTRMLNLMCLLFPYEMYYRLFVYIVRKIKL